MRTTTSKPESTSTRQRVVTADTHPHVTLAEIARDGEVGDVFGLTRPEGSDRKGFAMKRVLNADGTFGPVNGGELSGDWTDAQLPRLVHVGHVTAAQQRPKAKAKARARKAQAKAAPAKSERTPAQHSATLRMLEGKRDKLSGDKAAKKAAQASIDAYKAKHNI